MPPKSVIGVGSSFYQLERISMKNKAFTLIELLIVVAIIAILAAIAVPNFLEAQTRAKVSRVKSDMRTTNIGLEAYVIDNNNYPGDVHAIASGGPRFNSFHGRLSYITSPVAYISTVPGDLFATVFESETTPNSTGLFSGQSYRVNGSPSGDLELPMTFDYARFDNDLDSTTVWRRISSSPTSVRWALSSVGPDADYDSKVYLGFSDLVLYDSSNGTISRGQIVRTNVSPEDNPES